MSDKTKVKIQRGFCSSAGDVYPGDVVELPRHEAAIEVQKGRAALSDEAIGRGSEIQKRGAGGGKPGELAGYAGQPDEFPKKDPKKTVPIASAIKQAFKESGLSVDAWNAASDEDRKAAIAKIAEKIRES